MCKIKPVAISSPSFDGSFQLASTVTRESDQPQTTDRRDPWFPDDDEVREIASQAYALSEAAYPKNEGQGYFEDLLIRSTIGICRNKYQMADEKTTEFPRRAASSPRDRADLPDLSGAPASAGQEIKSKRARFDQSIGGTPEMSARRECHSQTTLVIEIDWLGGNCPVQAVGRINGKEFYFRARGNSWSLQIGGSIRAAPEWSYEEDYGDSPFAAGWMTETEARGFIAQAARKYVNRT